MQVQVPMNRRDEILRLLLTAIVAALFVAFLATWARAADALDVLNAKRVARGLHPYKRDAGLSIAAEKAAQYRAARGIEGHTQDDFSFVPKGSRATAAGCAAWDEGFGACCMYDTQYRYAGAAWVRRGGINWCHLYVR